MRRDGAFGDDAGRAKLVEAYAGADPDISFAVFEDGVGDIRCKAVAEAEPLFARNGRDRAVAGPCNPEDAARLRRSPDGAVAIEDELPDQLFDLRQGPCRPR